MHQAQWSPERPLPPPVSLASQSHREKPPEVTCTSRENPGFPASTRERPRETFFTTLPASCETCMQVKKQLLEPDMEQRTGSKLGKKYVKAVYCHPAYLTYMQSTS